MKVLLINGSPNVNGNTAIALNEMIKEFNKENIDCEMINIGNLSIRGCLDCNYCASNNKCIIDDKVNEVAVKLSEADGLVIGTPVYYASANGTLISFLDRLFHSNHNDLRMKVGASVAVARRGGITSTFDELNKYFTISEMPIVSSNYWNGVHGTNKGDAYKDVEGIATIRELAKNMIFLVRAIELYKKTYGINDRVKKERMDFIR